MNRVAQGVLTAIVAGSAAVGWHAFTTPAPDFRILVLDVGQGDAVVIQAGADVTLVDTGPGGADFTGGRKVIEEFRRRRLPPPRRIFLTHPDLDHVGGARTLASVFPGAEVWISEAFRDHPTVAELRGAVPRLQFLPPRFHVSADSLRIDGYGTSGMPMDNDNSIALYVTLGEATFVTTGDLGREAEMMLAPQRDWRASAMMAGHHGSQTSTSPEWLDAVQPRWVVISAGRNNRYGHPSAEVLARLGPYQVKRTDRDGTIQLRPQGAEWRVTTTAPEAAQANP